LSTVTIAGPAGEVARRVRAARILSGLTVGELGDLIGLGIQTIKRIEAGRRNARRYELWAIADACGVPREFFEADLARWLERGTGIDKTLERIDARLAQIDERLARLEGG
jgi:transcriptional regulator with XRE-family HTH domain